ncbi:ABC transporter permease [Rubneribacter sp.]
MMFRDLAYEAYHALSANRMRSALTILGIVIGISSVIAMTSMVGGIQDSMASELGGDQARVVNISPYVETGQADFEALAQQMPEYERIVLSRMGSGTLQHASKTYTPQYGITGAQPAYADATGLKFSEGSFFQESDERSANRVAVVGKGAVKNLFGDENASAVGQEITIGGDTFTIAGVLEGNASTSSYGSVYVPLSTLEMRLDATSEYLGTAIARGEPTEEQTDALVKKTAKTFTEILGGVNASETLSVYSMSQLLSQMNTLMGGFGLLLGGIAAISLLVGGIGIMNMMLTNVTERIREIGLRKALGARRTDIVRQFLLEAIALTLVGGVVGIAIGYAASWGLSGIVNALQPTMSFAPALNAASVGIAVGVSALIGVAFGFYPARRAARLDPIEALRFQ